MKRLLGILFVASVTFGCAGTMPEPTVIPPAPSSQPGYATIKLDKPIDEASLGHLVSGPALPVRIVAEAMNWQVDSMLFERGDSAGTQFTLAGSESEAKFQVALVDTVKSDDSDLKSAEKIALMLYKGASESGTVKAGEMTNDHGTFTFRHSGTGEFAEMRGLVYVHMADPSTGLGAIVMRVTWKHQDDDKDDTLAASFKRMADSISKTP